MFINSLSVNEKKRHGEKRIAGELSTEKVNLNIDTKESYKHSFKRLLCTKTKPNNKPSTPSSVPMCR